MGTYDSWDRTGWFVVGPVCLSVLDKGTINQIMGDL